MNPVWRRWPGGASCRCTSRAIDESPYFELHLGLDLSGAALVPPPNPLAVGRITLRVVTHPCGLGDRTRTRSQNQAP
jgi:hypothetical protein